ncbi:hypothetical protein ACRS64_27000 [Pseudomonas aeruginosa]|uniref:hypothetical protein n=1 Tax=Pseudomonas aeruginosa TaxID=287 RepID=UPI003DA6D34C
MRLGADGEARRLAFDASPDAWTHGMLMARPMPLPRCSPNSPGYRRGCAATRNWPGLGVPASSAAGPRARWHAEATHLAAACAHRLLISLVPAR